MSSSPRDNLAEALCATPRWANARVRRAIFEGLAWELGGTGREMPTDPRDAALALIDLALAPEGSGSADLGGAAARGIAGLIEDLRELDLAPALILDQAAEAWGVAARRAHWTHAPYPGLVPLEAWQAPIHFGRRAESRDLLRRLIDPARPRLQVVSGLPGCGKSSLVRAGVRARFGAGDVPGVPGAEEWLFSNFCPSGWGGDPFLALTHGLARESGIPDFDPAHEAASLKAHGAEGLEALIARLLDGRHQGACWVLVIDQLEELFSVVEPDLADELLETLAEALTLPQLRVIATLRADQMHRACTRPELVGALNQGGLYCLATPSRAALERMIRGPVETLAASPALTIEPRLVERLIEDAAQPGGLALLADALKELHDRGAADGQMTLEVYLSERLDGLRSVIARRAERAMARAGDDSRRGLARVFEQILDVAEDGTATRLRVDLTRLSETPEAAALIDALAAEDTRLLRLTHGARVTVELAHEALLHAWPSLRHWIERRREALRTRDQVLVEAKSWVALGHPPEGRWRHEVLEPARELLAETGLLAELERDRDVADFLIPKPDWLLAELLCSRVDAVQREEIGLRLAQIGDPRPGVGVQDGVPSLAWCDLPAGEVLIETHGVYKVKPFRIAAYPITQSQFEAFLDDPKGFPDRRWWQGIEQTTPVSGRLRRHGNYPATHVSWFDAVAFCRWLSARLGCTVRLPDEWEWQWAAQSAMPGFIYPWGRDWREGHANTDEGSVGRATAVGMYPQGRSRQGVYDLAGNTWEWCRNRYDKPKISTEDTEGSRVLRGGSWRVNMGFARADFRLDGLPEDRMWGSSFRVVTGVGEG